MPQDLSQWQDAGDELLEQTVLLGSCIIILESKDEILG